MLSKKRIKKERKKKTTVEKTSCQTLKLQALTSTGRASTLLPKHTQSQTTVRQRPSSTACSSRKATEEIPRLSASSAG